MGIFEKSIPKYVVHPLQQNVQVVPQEYVVDDIFDPILNARVRDALRQKYGGGLYGLAGGYSELLQNAWGGDKGILGKGMGVLSTFGRSMEKADDIVLGFLTEGVEGITGQGFDDPLKQIFSEDVDYSGKRFLASTANTFRNVVGTSITEDDLGTEWNLPALGIDLATDVGILGGGIARKFAPAAKGLTSKELFQRLGKSDLKTTVGEIGQLMSNYDDLMSKVAIDITAPGLRPAFKFLGNKLAQFIQTHAPKEFVDVELLMKDPNVRKAAAEYYANDPATQMVSNVTKQMDEIPVPEPEVTNVYKSPYQIAQELGDNNSLEFFNYVQDIIKSGQHLKLDEHLDDFVKERDAVISKKYDDYTRSLNDAFGKSIDKARAKGYPTDIGIDSSSNLWERAYDDDFDALLSLRASGMSLDDVRENLYAPEYEDLIGLYTFFKQQNDLPGYYKILGKDATSRSFAGILSYIDSVERAQNSLDEMRKIVLDTLGGNWSKATVKMPELTSKESEFVKRVVDAANESDAFKKEIDEFRREGLSPSEIFWTVSPDIMSKLNYEDAMKLVSDEPEVAESVLKKMRQQSTSVWLGDDTAQALNPTYADDVLEKLGSPESFIEALRSREWSTNAAVTNAIEAALGDVKHNQSVWYKSANPKYTVSPSRLTKLEAFGIEGTDTAKTILERARYFLGDPDKPRFKDAESLNKYLKTPEMTQAFKEFFPKVVDKKYIGSDKYTLDDIRQAIVDVFYPTKKGVSEYTAYLERLSKYFDDSKPFAFDKYSATQAKGLFLEDLYRAVDRIDQVYLQRLHDKPIRSKGTVNANFKVYSRRESAVDDVTGAISSTKPQELRVADAIINPRNDESLSTLSYIKSFLSQLEPNVKNDEELYEIVEDLLPFIQIKPVSSLSRYTRHTPQYVSQISGIPETKLPHHLVQEVVFGSTGRLAPSEETLKAVSNFKTNVYPKVKAYVDKYGDYTGMYVKGAEKEYYEVRRLLGIYVEPKWLEKYGLSLAPEPNGYANRVMFEALVDKSTGDIINKELSKFERNLILEDAAIGARLSKKLPTPETKFSDRFSQIIDAYRKEPVTSKNASEFTDSVKNTIASETPEKVAAQAYDVPSISDAAVAEVIKNTVEDVDKFINGGGTPEAAETIFGERKWSLYKQIQEASALKTKNALRKDRATLRTKITTALGKAFEAVTGKAKAGDFKRYYQLRAKMLGDTVSGADFWTTFRRSGILASAYAKGSDMIEPTYESLTKNAKIINDLAGGRELVEVVKYTLDNDNVAVVMRWKGDKSTLKYVKNLQKKLDSAKFNDVVFTKATALTTEEQAFMNSEVMRELSGLMDQLQTVAADQAQYLGFKFDNVTPYTKHAMRHDPFSATWINRNFYAKGMSSQGYDDISSLISDLDGYRQMDRGTFGTILQERRFRGDYWLLDDKLHPMFEYTPDKVFTSTLADGIFANLQYQTFTDLFINDNFKIKDWFTSVDDLKKVLYAKLPNGKVSGNLQNLELVSFKTDANGKVAGLIKHDKMSDAGLQKALADENTILVPANVVSHMDNILRKDVRMSNKFWTFINKHFTIPFKFGLLSNPGFLLGNVSDSILKLTTTMHQKYGTTMAEEAANAADSIASVINLKNIYYDAFNDWMRAITEHDIKIAGEAKIPEIVAMSPKYKDMFLKYLDGTLEVPKSDPISGKPVMEPVYNNLSKEQIDGARVWMMLQGMQMNTSKLREYAEVAELNKTSDFDVPTNIVDRILKGKGKFRWTKPKTWGLFMNNPVMKAFTNASGSWEELIRTASILDDLKHKRYTLEQMSEYSKYVSPDLGESRRLFDVHLEEAKSTMYSAQFDYERVNDFINKVGKNIPFPIFFLKNFQYWMELFMENPQYVDTAIDIQEGLWSGYNEDNDKFMTEAKGRGAIPVGGKALPKWFKGVYKPSPLQSMFGAFNLLNSPVDNLTYRVNPLMSGAKTAAASLLPPDNELTTLLSDPESVKYRPYSTDMYERNVKQGDKNFSPVKYTLHRMNPYDRAINAQLRLPAKVSEGDAQLADVFPSVFQPMF